jgi:hypothetical protein
MKKDACYIPIRTLLSEDGNPIIKMLALRV